MSKISSYSFLLIIAALIAVSSYFVPTGDYSYQTVETESGEEIRQAQPGSYQVSVQQEKLGIIDVLKSPVWGFYNAIEIIVFVLVLGGFHNLAKAGGLVNLLIIKLRALFKNRTQWLIPGVMSFFVILNSLFLVSEAIIPFYLVCLPLMLVLGFDTFIAVATLMIGASLGQISALTVPSAVELAPSVVLSSYFFRLVVTPLYFYCAYRYLVSFQKKASANSNEETALAEREASLLRLLGRKTLFAITKEPTLREKLGLATYLLAFLIVVGSFLPWNDLLPSKAWLPVLGFSELGAIFFGLAILIGVILRMSEKTIVKNFVIGLQAMTPVAITLGVAEGLKSLAAVSNLPEALVHYSETLLIASSSFVFLCGGLISEVLVAMLADRAVLSNLALPVFLSLGTSLQVSQTLALSLWQTANGLAVLFVPTSLALVGGLAIGRISFFKWLRFVMPLVGMLFVFILGVNLFGYGLGTALS